MSSSSENRSSRFFYKATERPLAVVAASAVAVLLCSTFLPGLRQDSRIEAFIVPDHPALQFRQRVTDLFGMDDPMVILVANDGPDGVFTPHTLALVEDLTGRVQQARGVEPGGVTSLATVKVIEPSSDGLVPAPLLDATLTAGEKAKKARTLVNRHRNVLGTLVADNQTSTLIVVERFDHADGVRIYRDFKAMADAADTSGGESLFVAGHGALTATLGDYIDSDTRVLYAIVTVVIAVVLAAAFRTIWGVVLPLVLIGATVAMCLGLMSASGYPFTVIFSALPVVLASLVVTDGLHILSIYYRRQAERPETSTRELVVESMTEIWRPCVGARVTDIAGFAGLYLGSAMPPMKSFGLFGSVGIAAEMVLSLVAYPCLILLVAPGPSAAFATGRTTHSVAIVRRFLDRAAVRLLDQTPLVVVGSVLVVLAGVTGIARMVVNDSWIANFDEKSPVHIASEALATRHGIRDDLDLVIDTGTREGMLEPSVLERIDRMKQELLALPGVTLVRSINDVFREIGATANAGDSTAPSLPATRDIAAQYLLIANSQDTRRWLDADQQRSLVRVHTLVFDYVESERVLEAVHAVVGRAFPPGLPTVTVGGMVTVGNAWVSSVGSFHVLSTALSVGFCWLQMVAGFWSWAMGSLAIIPMMAAMLLMYAVMGWGGIPLGIGTSMFAALAIGTGVDFAIHTIDRFMVLREEGAEMTLAELVREVLPTTGRTILYSATAIILGFSVLCLSRIPAVRSLGVLVTVSVVASLVATLTVLPAVIKVLRPKQLVGNFE